MSNATYLPRKQPLQERSKFTVGVIKEAAAHILREHGILQFTTNRVAEKAGVSIGSLYQYFPSKESLIAEVKRDHFQELRKLFKTAYEESEGCSLSAVTRALINASVDAHRLDPRLHQVLSRDLSEFKVIEDDCSDDSIRPLITNVLEKHRTELRKDINIPLAADIIYKIIEKVIHDSTGQDPDRLRKQATVDELYFLVMAYLTASDDDSSSVLIAEG